MTYTQGIEDEIETYKGYRIVVEHDLNLFEKTKETGNPIYTICGSGRCFQGTIAELEKFIDDMLEKYKGVK